MSFNPWEHKGIPAEKQVMNWSQLNVKPYDKNTISPYTRCRIILMNGAEMEATIFLHQVARHAKDMDLRRKAALARRAEQQQQKMVNWLIPADESTLEVTIGYEQVAVDLTAYLARTEPDPHVKAALDFALLEDFDHLYRYANLLEMDMGIRAENIVGEYTEITPGRPTIAEHRHPFDDVRRPIDSKSAELITKCHVATIVPAEQQTMNFYMNVGNRYTSELGRGLYLEIAQIEEQHVSHYESLIDPTMSWMERWVMHDFNEAYLYHSCMESETDDRIKKIWEHCLEMELGHLQVDRELMQQIEGRDPAEMMPEFPEPTIFQSNKEYVRQVLASQVQLTGQESEYVRVSELPDNHRFCQYQSDVNRDGDTPSHAVIERHIQEKAQDYRFESEGENPVRELASRTSVDKDVARCEA